MSKNSVTRRAFLAATTTTAAVAWSGKVNAARVVPGKHSPNEKLNIAGIAVGGKGLSDIMNCRKHNIVALCDVDWKQAEEAFYHLPDAKKYRDYRKMLEEMDKEIDACTVSTPDHMHAPAAYRAMKMGKHVYVQKPMTHTVAEARLLATTAREMGVATQMGNQGHSGKGVRELAEMLWSGAIGDVREVHIWTDRPGGRWPQGVGEAAPEEAKPESLDWDLWLGPAPKRAFSKQYHPHKWRGWWDFGCGALGDMGCHIMDPAFFALKLGDAKTFTAEPTHSEGHNPQTAPTQSITKYTFPARDDMPPVDIYWYDNGQLPERPASIPADQVIGDRGKNGSLFIGDQGYLTAGEYGGKPRLLPDARMEGYTKPDPTIPRRKDHYRDWFAACLGGKPACSNFDYAGPFTEMVLLGNLALRANKRVEYDVAQMAITNDEAANAFITKEYRPGWELPV